MVREEASAKEKHRGRGERAGQQNITQSAAPLGMWGGIISANIFCQHDSIHTPSTPPFNAITEACLEERR